MDELLLEKELAAVIENDEWMINALRLVRSLNLNDCWIGAGFVRNRIWDYKHGKERSALNDLDVIYFDPINNQKNHDQQLESKLKSEDATLNWSVKNQGRMHLRNGHSPYKDCNHAISFWPETATAVAVRLNPEEKIEYIAPHGLTDLFSLIVRPTPNFDLIVFKERVERKEWLMRWDKLRLAEVI